MEATCENILDQYKPINKYVEKLYLYPDTQYTAPHTWETLHGIYQPKHIRKCTLLVLLFIHHAAVLNSL